MSSESTYRLDLRQRQGLLERVWIDLPPQARPEAGYYVRQQEKSVVPPSYRTGLAFFVSVMLFATLGATVFAAKSKADLNRDLLSAQILQEFQLLAELSPDSPTVTGSDRPEAFSHLKTKSLLIEQMGLSPLLDTDRHQSHLADIGWHVARGYDHFSRLLEIWRSASAPLEKLEDMTHEAERAAEFWQLALERFEEISLDAVPDPEQAALLAVLSPVQDQLALLQGFLRTREVLPPLLGQDEPQRIVLFIQDDLERRATGGALSAGVEMVLDEGKIISSKAFHVDDYDRLFAAQIAPPAELAAISSRAGLATANDSLDLLKSAEKLQWFWQREARSSVDTMVFLSSSVLTELFPNDFSERFPLQWSVWRRENQRDRLLAGANKIGEKLIGAWQDPEGALHALPVLSRLISSKQFMVVSHNPQLQEQLALMGLPGPLPIVEDREDVLMVARINTQPQSNDYALEEGYQLHTSISEQGAIRHWLKIRHDFSPLSLNPLLDGLDLKNRSRAVSLSAANQSVMRVVVPKGSRLIETTGVNLTQVHAQNSDQFTVWAFPTDISPGQHREIALVYELPWTFDTSSVDNYRLRVLKQPGVETVAFQHLLKLPAQLSLFQQLPEQPLERLEQDTTFAAVLGRNP